ncbi:MAG: hypothetical protein H6672_00580 [Anaerolineaceae bacterium]|nr:hypothetical protein [Anaerolineaceae bacterium]
MSNLKKSPLLIVLLIGSVSLALLIAQGLSFGPLHTDVEVSLVWIDAYGFQGFMDHYLDFNQRHLLAAPRNALGYTLFGHNMLPYHLILQGSRVLEGAFLAGVVFQLTRRKWLAVAAGLALTFTPIRVAESFQSIGWGIETTLVMLLASTYTYILSLKAEKRGTARWLYWLSFALYAISILNYESGIPWIGVNIVAGWFVLDTVPWQERVRRLILHAIPFLLLGAALAYLVVVVFSPWDRLAPTQFGSYPLRILNWIGASLAFPALLAQTLEIIVHDGYVAWLVVGSVVGGALLWFIGRWMPPEDESEDRFGRDVLRLIVLALVMIACAVLVGASNPTTRYSYQDRITFSRAAGVMLLYVMLLAGAVYLLRRFTANRARLWEGVALVLIGVVVVGPGFAIVQAYRSEGEAAYTEVEHVAEAVLDVRCLFYRPLHIVIVTDPDWVVSRTPDAHDVIIRQAQILIDEAQGDVTIDILKTGNTGYEDDFIPAPGTCELDFASGLCLDADGIRSSRWASPQLVSNEDIVLLHYANDGTMTLLREIDMQDLAGYNIGTSEPGVLTTLRTNESRLALPFDEMPVPLTSSCPGN